MAAPILLEGPGAGWGFEQTLMHLHSGWAEPKAGGESSLG